MWKAIQTGNSPRPQVTDQPTEAVPHPIAREKTDDEYTDAENLKEQFDIQVAGILSQGLPRRIFNILNRTSTVKEIWDSLELLMKGSGKTLESYWSKYVTHTKNVMNMSADNYIDIFTHLRTYKPHTLKSLKKLEQSSSSDVDLLADVDPLAYLAKLSTPPQPSLKPTTQATQTHEEALMATMQQLANLLSGFQKQFPPTNNQLRASSNPRSQATVQAGQIVTETVQRSAPGNVGKQGKRENQANGSKVVCYNCRGEGHVARQCKEPKQARNSQWYADKALLLNAQEKGEVLDAEAEFLI
nr:hypothetical protein [Tanacetum cinerariifolium]